MPLVKCNCCRKIISNGFNYSLLKNIDLISPMTTFYLVIDEAWSRLRKIREHVNDFPHGGSGRALVLNAHHGYLEQVNDTSQRVPTEPGIYHRQDWSRIGRLREFRCCFANPSHYIHAITKFPYRFPSCNQLQQHDTKAVHVAFLVHFKRVCILYRTTKINEIT